MPKFRFRLEQVLRYRELIEESARDSYLEARALRLEAERELGAYARARCDLIARGADTIQSRMALEASLRRQDELEADHRIALEVLRQEEEAKRSDWIVKRQEVQVLEKLRDREHEQWRLEERRREQREMDEFAVLGAAR